MEFKGTKGKWEAKDLFNNWIIVSKENDYVLNIKGNKANAQLIASAPELLEALDNMMFIFKSMSNNFPTPAEEFNCYKQAQQAINKALGL